MNVNYSELSVSELQEAINKAQNALDEKKDAEKATLKAEILELVKSRGFSMEELFGFEGKGKKKAKVAVTHQDPKNPSHTWSGRGRKPKWLVEAIENGAKIEDFVI